MAGPSKTADKEILMSLEKAVELVLVADAHRCNLHLLKQLAASKFPNKDFYHLTMSEADSLIVFFESGRFRKEGFVL